MLSTRQRLLLKTALQAINKNRQIDNLVLGAGAIKGFAHIGALYALEKAGIIKYLKRIMGTSVGSLFAFALAINFSVKEIEEIVFQLTLFRFFNFSSHDNTPVIRFNSKLAGFINDFYHLYKNLCDIVRLKGIFNGEYIEKTAQACINAKFPGRKTLTFEELHELTKINPIAYKDLYIPAIDMNHRQLVVLSHETTPEMPITLALQATTAVPFIFKGVEYKGKFYSDGGLYAACFGSYFDDEKYLDGARLNSVGANMRTLEVALSSPERTAQLRDNHSTQANKVGFLNFLTLLGLSPLDAQNSLAQTRGAPLRSIYLNTENIFLFDIFVTREQTTKSILDAKKVTKEYIDNYIKNVRDPHSEAVTDYRTQVNKIKMFILFMQHFFGNKYCSNHSRFFKKPVVESQMTSLQPSAILHKPLSTSPRRVF